MGDAALERELALLPPCSRLYKRHLKHNRSSASNRKIWFAGRKHQYIARIGWVEYRILQVPTCFMKQRKWKILPGYSA